MAGLAGIAVALLPDAFVGDVRLAMAARFLAQAKGVTPRRRLARGVGKVNLDGNFRVTPRRQTANPGYAAAVFDRLLEAAAFRLGDVPKETEDVEEVRFARSIGSDNELAFLEVDVDGSEVAPILRCKMTDNHGWVAPIRPV